MPIIATLALLATQLSDHEKVRDALMKRGLSDLGAYRMLSQLCTEIGPRISGSPQAAKAVEWADRTMRANQADSVFQVACMVPHWVRGSVEEVQVVGGPKLNACALGNSPGTEGITAEVVEVHSLAEVKPEKVKGKIVFYNRPFDETLRTTFEMYGRAGDQRFVGPAVAAKAGAVGALVRSMTSAMDDQPHTGTTRFGDGPTVPCAALGRMSADRLSTLLKKGPVQVDLKLSCQTLADEPSASVVGEIRGSAHPDEVIVIGGHLDSWDKGQGAHDDGAGVTEAMEALRLIKALGLKPKRTIRAVAFMDEENGGRGAAAYAKFVRDSGVKPYAAIESDSGGFMPVGFGVDRNKVGKVFAWQPLLEPFGIYKFTPGGGGADVGPLGEQGAVLFGLTPVDSRYFDYHHSHNDTLDKVNPREVEFGAMSMAMLAWLISEEGL